jgi:glycosyltransferase involved in cell wall biosynthesis
MIDILAVSPPSFVDVNRAIYRELAKRGWSVEVVIPDSNKYADGIRFPDEKRVDDPPLHRLPLTSLNQRLRTFQGLSKLLSRRRPRIVYIDSDPASLMTIKAGLWGRRNGAHIVCQSCDNLSRTFNASFERSGFRGILSVTAIRMLACAARPNVAHIFSINTDGLRVFSELGFKYISLIPLGFDPVIFHPDVNVRKLTRAKLGLQQLTIAFFGMLRWTKGVHILIEALEGLMEYDWQLLMDDFGVYQESFTGRLKEMLGRSPVGQRVVFFDAEHREMAAYMNAADIVVLPAISTPTVKEQYGRAVAEAMACGRMVIISDSGALPEIVGNAGLKIPENNVQALRMALKQALQDPILRQQYSENAFDRAQNKLSINNQAEIMTQTFKRLLEMPGK